MGATNIKPTALGQTGSDDASESGPTWADYERIRAFDRTDRAFALAYSIGAARTSAISATTAGIPAIATDPSPSPQPATFSDALIDSVSAPGTGSSTSGSLQIQSSNEPVTALHYAPNANLAFGSYNAPGDPGSVGFNLADVSSVSDADALPDGVQALIFLGDPNGLTADFEAIVNAAANDPKVYGFYVADVPADSAIPNLAIEDAYIAQHAPGKVSFIVAENLGTPANPSYTMTPANTGADLVGLDPYPVRPEFTGGMDLSVIDAAVQAAEAVGWSVAQIVPVYQAFGGGGYSSWTLPTAAQEQQILAEWGQLTPTPAFDYAYSWGIQLNDAALVDTPDLQTVFAQHNALGVPSETLPASYGGDENAILPLAGLSVAVVPNADDPLTVQLGVAHGTIAAGGTSGAAVTLSGTAATINDALAGATYTGALNYYGADTLSMTTIDTADSAAIDGSATITLLQVIQLADGPHSVRLGDTASHVTGGNGCNRITGDNGNDIIALGNGSNTVVLGDGIDSVTVGNGNNRIALGNGDDFVTAGNGNNTIVLGDGNDSVAVGDGNNTIVLGDAHVTLTTPDFTDLSFTGEGYLSTMPGGVVFCQLDFDRDGDDASTDCTFGFADINSPGHGTATPLVVGTIAGVGSTASYFCGAECVPQGDPVPDRGGAGLGFYSWSTNQVFSASALSV
jgi:hypothetical protein